MRVQGSSHPRNVSQVARSTSIETRKCFAFRDFFMFSPGVSESDASLFLWKVASITHGLNSFRPRGLFGLCVDVKTRVLRTMKGSASLHTRFFSRGCIVLKLVLTSTWNCLRASRSHPFPTIPGADNINHNSEASTSEWH